MRKHLYVATVLTKDDQVKLAHKAGDDGLAGKREKVNYALFARASNKLAGLYILAT